MIQASLLENIVYKEDGPAISVLLNTPYVKEIRIVFRKDQIMKEHKAAFPIVIEIVEGTIDFGANQERRILTKGSLITLDANIMHDLRATQDSIIRLSLNKADDINRVQSVNG